MHRYPSLVVSDLKAEENPFEQYALVEDWTPELLESLQSFPAVAVTPTADAILQSDSSGKLDPAWIDMLDVTLGLSAASKVVSADSSGNVGIGRTPTASPLEVGQASGDSNAGLRVYNSSGSAWGELFVTSGGTPTFRRNGTGANFGITASGVIQFASGTFRVGYQAGGMSVGSSSFSPTAIIDIDSDTIRLRNKKTPASSSATGNQGERCWDDNYEYRCVTTNKWKRAALSTW